jgi:hypothetical protein
MREERTPRIAMQAMKEFADLFTQQVRLLGVDGRQDVELERRPHCGIDVDDVSPTLGRDMAVHEADEVAAGIEDRDAFAVDHEMLDEMAEERRLTPSRSTTNRHVMVETLLGNPDWPTSLVGTDDKAIPFPT